MDVSQLSLAPGDRVLHFPCGDGALCREIAAQVPLGVVIGLDPSDDNVRAARAASADVDNVMFLCGDLNEIPWKEGYFSRTVIDGGVSTYQEVYRVLAEGGRAFLPSATPPKELEAEGFEEISADGAALITATKLPSRPLR